MMPPVEMAAFHALQQASKLSKTAQSAPVRAPAPRWSRKPRLDVLAVMARFVTWRRRRATRIVLSALDDRTLRDIGLHRSEIEASVRSIEVPKLR